jgi:hypothetical protein
MNRNEPKGEAQARTAETTTAESEEITGKFAIDLALLDEVAVDDGTGRTPDPLVSVKRRIREAVESAGQS